MIKFFQFFTLVLFMFCGLTSWAQDRSVGVRIGSGAGITFRQIMPNDVALEGILMYRRGGLRVVGLAEIRKEIGRSNTFFIAGVGGHAGVNRLTNPEVTSYTVLGLDGLIGLEYVFPRSDMALTFDLKPMFEILQGWRFSGNSGGVSLRFPLD
ncbi:MAG: hypothetical protein AAFY71_04180 [Bacteroidota bacterium]